MTTPFSNNKPITHDLDGDGYGVDLFNHNFTIEHNSDGYGDGCGEDPLNHHYQLNTIQMNMEMDLE